MERSGAALSAWEVSASPGELPGESGTCGVTGQLSASDREYPHGLIRSGTRRHQVGNPLGGAAVLFVTQGGRICLVIKARSPLVTAALSGAACVLVGLLLGGCASGDGSVSGQLHLSGRIPGGGRAFTVGAVQAGQVVARTKVRRGGRFTFSAPAGHYQVGLWIPGQPPTAARLTCRRPAADLRRGDGHREPRLHVALKQRTAAAARSSRVCPATWRR